VAHSVLLILVPAAVAATGAAFEASRLRKRRDENAVNARSTAVVLFDALWPSYVAGLLIQLLAIVLVSTQAAGGASGIPWGLLIAIAAILAFHTSVGFLLGALLRPVIAIPLALAFSYSWLGFTGTVDWFPLRHLAGLVLETCCFYDEAVSSWSIIAATTFSVGVASACLAASAALLHSPGRPGTARFILPVGLALASSVLGLAAASALTSTAAVPRSPDELVCDRNGIEVCLYPEQLGDAETVETMRAMMLRLEDLGVTAPDRVVAGRDGVNADVLEVRYLPGMTTPELAGSIASSFRGDQLLNCSEEPVEETIERQQSGDTARSWLTGTMAGQPITQAGAAEGAPEGAYLSALERLSIEKQVQWINAVLRSMDSCDSNPPGAPS